MHENNKAFVLDYPFDDSVFWTYNNKYQGGSLTFDVDVSSVGCGCAAGVYLAALNDDECSWNSYPVGTKPQCPSIDIMEANTHGFVTAPHPCENGECEAESQCKRRATSDENPDAYGPGSLYTIDTTRSFTVNTQFWTNRNINWDYTNVSHIKTVLMQDDREVEII